MTLEKFTPLMDYENVERVLYTWANKSTGLECVFAQDENAPQPDRPYVSLDYDVVFDHSGRLQIDEVDDGKISRTLAALQLLQVTADVWTQSTKPQENALRYVDSLVTAVAADTYREELFIPNGFGVLNVGDAEKIPMLEDDARWRSRAQVVIRFAVASNLAAAESFDYIESAALTGTITGGVLDPLTAATSVSA